ncbi:hypothetical protein GNY06_01375, partial [Elizabethkingia argentiflava]|nr:hypothetical protein [Elizabethkingia argenteiflava]
VDPLAEKMPSWSPYSYSFNNPVNFVDPDGREPFDWIRQTVNGKNTWTYDASIKTASQATAAGYSNVEGVYSSATISRESTLGFGGYQYELRSTGWVEEVSSGSYISMENDFVTGGGTAINGVQHRPTFADKMGFSDGPIQYIGGAGDVTGIFEIAGMALSSSDSNLKYAALPLLVAKGQSDDALKVLSAEKGAFSGAVHGNSLSSQRPTWGYKLYNQDGTFLKNGITSQAKAESRYTKSFMSDKYMEKQPFPNRREAYNWEAAQNQIQKGPLNKNNH